MKTVRVLGQIFLIILIPLISLLIQGCIHSAYHKNPEYYDSTCSDHPDRFGCLTEVEMSAEARSQLKKHSNIRVIHYSPQLPFIEVLDPFGGVTDKIAMTDLLPTVKAQFLATVLGELRLSSFDVVQEPHPRDTDRVLDLKQLYGQGLVLDFRTLRLSLSPYLSGYRFSYKVRARLIRAEDSTFLWQTTCYGGDPISPIRNYTLEQLRANDDSLLKVKADEAVRKCTDQLSASFLGLHTYDWDRFWNTPL